MSEQHPIEGLMRAAMNSIQDMVDVNTIVGEPIETAADIMIIPISKICFGFVAGGSEFNSETLNEYKKKDKEEEMQYKLPFGGGSGAAVSINPVAFLVINDNNVKLMPINHASTVDKLIDYIPDVIEKFCPKNKDEVEKTDNNNKGSSNSDESKVVKETTIKTEIDPRFERKVAQQEYLEDE